MLDHVLGRPSVKSRKLQVLAVLSFWSIYLARGSRHGPPVARFLSKALTQRITVWQTVVITMMYLYGTRNFSTLVGLASPDPMSNAYDPQFYRATWILTALDAGFWTAMKIRSKTLRDMASIAFTIFYMFATEKADEKVRKVRGNLTIDHLRISWNKGTTPYLRTLQNLTRHKTTKWAPRAIRISRPGSSDYNEPVVGWLYFDGPESELKDHTKIVLDIPGGGYVAMGPRCCDDRLLEWATKTKLPVLSLDYRKAPEYPYPYALNECYDVYSTVIRTKGRCIGLSGDHVPDVVVTGDSAGGSLATGMTIMIIESGALNKSRFPSQVDLPIPHGLILFYPGLDVNIGNWMSDEQMSLMKDRGMRHTNKAIIRRKSMQYNNLAGTPHHSDDEDDRSTPRNEDDTMRASKDSDVAQPKVATLPRPEFAHVEVGDAPVPSLATTLKSLSVSHRPEPLRTRLATSSMISYFNDRVLTPEMMRAMILLYIGPHNRPDFSQDYLLSPILVPDIILAKFPKCYFLTGERDPLVDDTIIFAGRLKRVKAAMYASHGRRTDYLENDARTPGFDDRDVAEVSLIPGISHGFLNFSTVYPPAWKYIDRSACWIEDIFNGSKLHKRRTTQSHAAGSHLRTVKPPATNGGTVSSEDEASVLKMSMTKMRSNTLTNGDRLLYKVKPAMETEEDAYDSDLGALLSPVHDEANEKKKNGRSRRPGDDSLIRLASSDDVLGRRMEGLAGPLTGLTDD